MLETKDVSSKTCLITGASRGLGKYLAEYFWQKSWNLLLVARDQKQLEQLVDSLEKRDDQNVHCISADFGEESAPFEIIKTARSLTANLDLLINNAACQGSIGPLWENDWQEWEKTIRVNLLAPVALCKEAASWMLPAKKGGIINLSGGGATGPRANFTAYATAKAGLVRFSETLAEELKSFGITVNCLAPGTMGTDMMKEVVSKGDALAGKREYEIAVKTLKEGGTSMEKVAHLCHFLANESGSEITGKLISAVWDNWEVWPEHLAELSQSDVYTLRRIAGRDRGLPWGDK